VARLHRAPEIPADVPSEWADLIRSMTDIEPLRRPAAGDVETALRQALVSPASTPGELTREPTLVLPAMPFRPPSISSPEPSREDAAPGTHKSTPHTLTLTDQRTPSRHPAKGRIRPRPARRRKGRSRGMGNWIWLAVVLAVVAVLAVAAALTASLSKQSTSDVVPYPTVTGTLGDHLKDLQKSVQP